VVLAVVALASVEDTLEEQWHHPVAVAVVGIFAFVVGS